jgi:hypothetical protein
MCTVPLSPSPLPLLQAGVSSPVDMLAIMSGIRPLSGSARTLWTSIMDLNARTVAVYYRLDYGCKYEFGF